MVNVDSHQLALRSIILGVISDFSEEQVRGGEGRELLADALRDAINAKLEELENLVASRMCISHHLCCNSSTLRKQGSEGTGWHRRAS